MGTDDASDQVKSRDLRGCHSRQVQAPLYSATEEPQIFAAASCAERG